MTTSRAELEELLDRIADDERTTGFTVFGHDEAWRLGRTIRRWRDQIVAWHRSYVTNGPTEAINNLVKRVKRVAFGMRRFRNYRIRALLYAGRPNWTLLDTLTPP